jgi:transcriptional regulator with XRE-family HTH domain
MSTPTLGQVLRELRGARTQVEVEAAAKGRHGIAQSAISSWESDERQPSLRALAWLLSHYGATRAQYVRAIEVASPSRSARKEPAQ